MARPRATVVQTQPSPVSYRRMRLADPDLAESIVRTFLLHHAQAEDLQLSYHAQALLAGLYRTTYPMLLERLSLRHQTQIEALKKK